MANWFPWLSKSINDDSIYQKITVPKLVKAIFQLRTSFKTSLLEFSLQSQDFHSNGDKQNGIIATIMFIFSLILGMAKGGFRDEICFSPKFNNLENFYRAYTIV